MTVWLVYDDSGHTPTVCANRETAYLFIKEDVKDNFFGTDDYKVLLEDLEDTYNDKSENSWFGNGIYTASRTEVFTKEDFV